MVIKSQSRFNAGGNKIPLFHVAAPHPSCTRMEMQHKDAAAWKFGGIIYASSVQSY